jgi:alkylation response protein AidB-like acyl-CoA dehydrogenase
MEIAAITGAVQEVAARFAAQRGERQRRRELSAADFDELKAASLHLTGALAEHGGLWEDTARSTRPICELLRVLAQGDSSVALVCAMHPSVLAVWYASPQATPPATPAVQAAWDAQRRQVSESAAAGAWWGTIISEPGSGGDVFRTKAIARRDGGGDGNGDGWRISGQKHFGSGSGITSYMITTAVAEGEAEPDLFFMDVRGVPWDGSAGVKLIAPWDGHGMIATQSHGMLFEDFPATRCAWPGNLRLLAPAANPFIQCTFTAVVVGIAETALDAARRQLAGRRASLTAYEQVEWTRAEKEGWLIRQAYEGMLRAVEEERPGAAREVLMGKTAVAELAEACLDRLCKVMGGGTYARFSPFGFWQQDVRALGFLRPPWTLAYDQLFQGAFPPQ